MTIGSLFDAGSSISPGLFEDILKNQDYSQVFGDTSTAFGGNTVDLFGGGGGWNFVEPSNSNTPDFSSIFSSPAPGGLNLSQGFNSPGNLFEPSKGLTFDPGSVSSLETDFGLLAQGGSKPRNLVRAVNPDADNIRIRQLQRAQASSQSPGSLRPVQSISNAETSRRQQQKIEASRSSPGAVNRVIPTKTISKPVAPLSSEKLGLMNQEVLDNRVKQYDGWVNPNIRDSVKFLTSPKFSEYFGEKIMSLGAISGFLGNIIHETGGFKNADQVEHGTGEGRGPYQYTDARGVAYKNYWKNNPDKDPQNINHQWEYAGKVDYGNKDLSGWTKAFRNPPSDTLEASRYFMEKFFRPDSRVAHLPRRDENAQIVSAYITDMMRAGVLPDLNNSPTYGSVSR